MEHILNIAPQLAIAAFMFYAFKWLVTRIDPHISRLLDSIEGVRRIGAEMVQANRDVVAEIKRAIDVFQAQQDWQEHMDAVLMDRHKRVMERFDSLEGALTRILLDMRGCPHKHPGE